MIEPFESFETVDSVIDGLYGLFADEPEPDGPDGVGKYGRRASDISIIPLDNWMKMGRFEDVSTLLAKVNVNRIHPSAVLGLLSISDHAKEHLPNRQEFAERALSTLRKRLGVLRAEKLTRWCRLPTARLLRRRLFVEVG